MRNSDNEVLPSLSIVDCLSLLMTLCGRRIWFLKLEVEFVWLRKEGGGLWVPTPVKSKFGCFLIGCSNIVG